MRASCSRGQRLGAQIMLQVTGASEKGAKNWTSKSGTLIARTSPGGTPSSGTLAPRHRRGRFSLVPGRPVQLGPQQKEEG